MAYLANVLLRLSVCWMSAGKCFKLTVCWTSSGKYVKLIVCWTSSGNYVDDYEILVIISLFIGTFHLMSYLVRKLLTVLVADIHLALYPSLVPRPFLSEEMKLLYSGIHMWQSRIEIEYHSVAYFKCITEFDAL